MRTDPLSALLEAVAAQAAVENERSVQAIAHIGDIALERRPGDAEPFLQFLAGDRLVRAENLVDLVDTFHAAHGYLSGSSCLYFRLIKQAGRRVS